ncbi:hypothetical protein DY000_02058008 [Brassica cretica]|uniref:Uncharacterized protein n=1 Tax=Brassica cretica TaxID=69181 RepID=A0ABQ7ACM6_BRACR|nr:hypothetical protein DY000_02058008 [Brassica cretica]
MNFPFAEERNMDPRAPLRTLCDVPRFVDQSIGAKQHGDRDVLNNLTEVRSSDSTGHTDRAVLRASRLELRLEPRPDDRTTARLPRPTRHSKTHSQARLSLGREETEDEHAFSSGRPSGQSCKRPYRYPVHTSVPEVSFAFSDHIQHPVKVILPDFGSIKLVSEPLWLKQRKRQNRSNDEKWVRSGDRPFTKAKRSNRVVLDQNELQTYARLEKMLHKAIHAIRQLKRKGNTNTSSNVHCYAVRGQSEAVSSIYQSDRLSKPPVSLSCFSILNTSCAG